MGLDFLWTIFLDNACPCPPQRRKNFSIRLQSLIWVIFWYLWCHFFRILVRGFSSLFSNPIIDDCNGIRTYNHLVRKWTLNHLANMAKWLSCVVRIYLYGAFDCMLLPCHLRVSQSESTLYSCLNVKELFAPYYRVWIDFKKHVRDMINIQSRSSHRNVL